MKDNDVYILGIESSCDDTSAAVLRNDVLLSNVTASQSVHEAYGGVVPELASRAHQQNVVPVVSEAIKRAGISKEQLSAVAFTRGPGLMGSLLVGVNFAKGLARSLGIPLIDVNHLQGHVMAHFIRTEESGVRSEKLGVKKPHPRPLPRREGSFRGLSLPLGGRLVGALELGVKSSPDAATPHSSLLTPHSSPLTSKLPPVPFLCLLVSGGNSQIVRVDAYNKMTILGQTIDDAAGEAIDKCSKVMGLGYPGGPIIDRLARQGDPHALQFAEPQIPGYDYSFSGLKTSFLYNLRKWLEDDPQFIEHHKEDLAASLEWTIVDILMRKLRKAVKDTGIKHVAVAGGVSANTGLRNAFNDHARRYGWTVYIPPFSYTTDNAAMIAVTGYYKFLDRDFCDIDAPAFSKVQI